MKTELTFYERVRAVQNELHAPKNQKNNFGGYMYRSAEDILTALKPLLHKYRLLQLISNAVYNNDGRYYVESEIRIYDIKDDKREPLVVTATAREPETKKGMDVSQITGAATSYANKYALNNLWLIDDNKDADRPVDDQQEKDKKVLLKQLRTHITKANTLEQLEKCKPHLLPEVKEMYANKELELENI